MEPRLERCGCPNGCVVVRLGYVAIHLPRPVFLAFARSVAALADAMRREPTPAES